ncbi:tyrosine recombinase [Cohnella lubricantis]|uniref:Tyrosine recombinase XerC n=2 Tax=Cohnella lubricantis TaxID=2163172 RepID=A0A841T9P3_9BACL|nr:tyrosine recombinase [Cohnella lubricantis]
MEQILTAYLEQLGSRKRLAPNTMDGYRRDLADLIRCLQQMGISELSEVRPHHLSAYMAQLRGKARSNATVQRRAVSIRTFFRYLADQGLVAVNPAMSIEAPRNARQPPRVLSEDEAVKLLESASADTPAGIRDRTMLETLYASGVRVSELLALDTSHVRVELGLLVCTGPGGKERMVPISSVCAEWMLKYVREARPKLLRQDKPQSALFLNHLGSRMTRQGFWKRLKQIAAEAGVDAEITPHTLRISFASHLLARGADLHSVQEMMGHAVSASTQFYQPAVKARLKEVYERAHPRSGRDH